MPLEILPVFVSSTWRDLEPEREAVEAAVHRLRETKFVGMEYFGSRDETTRRASLDEVDRSRVYVGIFAARYGSGITEEEYRRARERGLPCLIYFKDDSTVTGEQREKDSAKSARLDALKRELRENHIVGPAFKNPGELAARVTADLHNWLFDKYLTPKLQDALRGDLPPIEAQALLDAIKDLNSLGRDLLTQLQAKGFGISVGSVGGDLNIYNVSAPVVPTLHQLRAPVGDFVGRAQEIKDLTAALRGGANAAISGISGMGGIGKTELAYYVAEQLKDTYPDAQLVVDMRGTDERPRDPSDALASCIRAFVGLEQRLPDDLAELTRLYRSVLEGKRALILLDNARDGAQVSPLLPPTGSALLVTSRETITVAGMKRLTLEQLRPAEARELLTGIAPRVPESVADQICHLCGYLPLAVRAAASLLDITADLEPADYAAQLAEERTRLERIGVDPLIGIDVEASIGLSYARLSPDTARVFRNLAVFPATFDAKAEEVVCQDENHKHLSDLLRRNLVIYTPDTRRYRLHDLARLFAASRLSETERSASHVRHAAKYLNVLIESSKLYQKGGQSIKSGLALFDAEQRNIEAGQRWACQYANGDETSAWLCNEYPKDGGFILTLRQHPRELILWLEAALAAARQLKDRSSEGAHLANLGYVYVNLGDYHRSIELYERASVVIREVGNRRSEGMYLGNLGLAYTFLGEWGRAIEYYEQQLLISREVSDRRGEAMALGNMGIAYAGLGETHHAIELYEQSLAIHREIGELRGEAAVSGDLGNAYANLGDTARAIELYEQQLAISREIGDRRAEGNALYNTALRLYELGNRAQAIVYAKEAIEIYEQIESPATQKARLLLAELRGEA